MKAKSFKVTGAKDEDDLREKLNQLRQDKHSIEYVLNGSAFAFVIISIPFKEA
jgi:hypothetical protein